jgi:hypothetical protein
LALDLQGLEATFSLKMALDAHIHKAHTGQHECAYTNLLGVEIQKTKKPAVFRRRLWKMKNEGVRVNLQLNHHVMRCGHYTPDADITITTTS